MLKFKKDRILVVKSKDGSERKLSIFQDELVNADIQDEDEACADLVFHQTGDIAHNVPKEIFVVIPLHNWIIKDVHLGKKEGEPNIYTYEEIKA